MFDFLFRNKKVVPKGPNYIKPVVLLILDGWGVAPPSEGNAIQLARKPNFDALLRSYPNGQLIASGEAVGLPANEVGSTEVGHFTMGAGRLILQDLKRISESIKEGSFFLNKAIRRAAEHVKANNSKLHLMGLVGSGHVHSSMDHLQALLQFCKNEEIEDRVFVHAFTDGRDSPPYEGKNVIGNLEQFMTTSKVGKIASIAGRYYAMDRDRRWERTEKAYQAIVLGQGFTAVSSEVAMQASYDKKVSDEFIVPTIITSQNGVPVATVDDRDAVIFFNYRIDRPRQLTMAFTIADFENLKSFDFGYNPDIEKLTGTEKITSTFKRVKVPQGIFFVSMTEYQKNLPVSAIAFPPQIIQDGLSFAISSANLRQLHMAESEKERFVNYYFNGLVEEKKNGEESLIVPSPHVATYDRKPEMSVRKVVWEFKKALEKSIYHFFVINFANADMVAHSGNLKATVKAVEILDQEIANMVEAVLAFDGCLFITADHGNAEELLSYPHSTFFFTTDRGSMNTDHSNNPVPYIVIRKDLFQKPTRLPQGSLSDVAPTILGIMNIAPTEGMTGKDLLKSQ